MNGYCKHGMSNNAFHCISCANEEHARMNTAVNRVDHAPTYCRFLGDTETCRMGLNVAEHRLVAGGFQHPDGLDQRGYYAFDQEAVQ